ncbi:unnamed protein product [Blumeria hordei]|uniref:Actin-related protein 2/3 complex subunit 5 n=1 Tax=Blumeria hordei TaxID=2867405 RepID=A0A383UXG8_BLUHO|nr:unnamed protein product [Blumeria hordei]
MSIIQQQSNATISDNWRTINIDLLDPESSSNFDVSSLQPKFASVSEAEIRVVGQQVRQLLRGGDAEGALRSAIECAPYGAEPAVKEHHYSTVFDVLQSIKASEMAPLVKKLYEGEGGVEMLDVLTKYLYKGMAASSLVKNSNNPQRRPTITPQTTGRHTGSSESGGAAMSVLLSWHEKVIEIAGLGCISRCMTDGKNV